MKRYPPPPTRFAGTPFAQAKRAAGPGALSVAPPPTRYGSIGQAKANPFVRDNPQAAARNAIAPPRVAQASSGVFIAPPPVPRRPVWTAQLASVVQRAAEGGRPKRETKLSEKALVDVIAKLVPSWQALTDAGSHNAVIDLESEGKHACAARGTWDDQAHSTFEGKFHADSLHAEMDILDQAYRVATADELLKIEIETKPCPRCAVILNKLKIGGKVTYKNAGGYKDYPTWRFPDFAQGRGGLAELLGIPAEIDAAGQETILKFFQTHKWW